jgi:hypothetical protein
MMKAAGLALVLAMAPGASKAVEIYNNGKDASVDLGMRYQVMGEFDNLNTQDSAAPVTGANPTGAGPRDLTRIYLFQTENRLKMTAMLDGVEFKFEDAFGSEAYAGGNNLYDLLEMDGKFPVTDNLAITAGLSKMPDNNASATYEENMLFTSHSQLLNMFFNKGYDTAVFASYKVGLFDTEVGTEQGAPNLPERYIPERLEMPVPVFMRIGVGNIKDDPTRFKEIGFEKSEGDQWAAHLNGFWLGDSSAGHGTLFSQMSTQADAPKGPFVNGNEMFSKNYNPYLAAGASSMGGALGPVNNQFWQAAFDAQYRKPLGGNWLIAGAQYSIAQFVAPNIAPIKLNGIAGPTTKFGQITNQGFEAYVGLDSDKWYVASRLDVLIADMQQGFFNATTTNGPAGSGIVNRIDTVTPIFNSEPIYELEFPTLGWKFSKYSKLVAELEHNFNVPLGVDTDGVYNLKSVPVEGSLNKYDHIPYAMTGRLMFQVAF